MKRLIQLCLLLISTTTFALNPVQGFYIGLLGEMSSGPGSYTLEFRELPDPTVFVGQVNNSRISGGGGGMLGYRYQNFRLEGEVLYNWVSSGTLTIADCTLQSPAVQTPTGNCVGLDRFDQNLLGFNGSVAATYGLVNAYWDFINYNSDSGVFPYVGLGVGYAQIINRGNFVKTNFVRGSPSHGTNSSFTSIAAQGILGVGMFLDDFTWGGMDYRYLSTNTIKNYGNSRYAINTINFTISLAFDTAKDKN